MDQFFQIARSPKTRFYALCIIAIVTLMRADNAQATINHGIWKFSADGQLVLYRRERSEGGDGDSDHSGSGDQDGDNDSDGTSGSSSGSSNNSSNGGSRLRSSKKGERDSGFDLLEKLKQYWR